jgi:hypothetical protein
MQQAEVSNGAWAPAIRLQSVSQQAVIFIIFPSFVVQGPSDV